MSTKIKNCQLFDSIREFLTIRDELKKDELQSQREG
jgi:hypothetical protein